MNNIPILDLKPQYHALKNDIHAALERVMESGAFIMGPDVAAFEQECATYLGVRHAIGLNSGTDALFLALRALNIGPGDEVITTPFSFFATAEAISHVGATPVFVDINEEDFLINPMLIESVITAKTKAIIPVHLYGNPAAMSSIMAIASKHNIAVVEDCAQSFGAVYQGDCVRCTEGCTLALKAELSGKMTGTIGHVGTYSFFPSKNLGAYGDGGLLVTNDDAIAETVRMLRVHGAKKKYHNEAIGYNSRLDTVQAAILRVKLPFIDQWNNSRRAVAERYNALLEQVEGVVAPKILQGAVFHQYTVRILNGKRDAVQQYLTQHGIGTMIYYPIPQDKLPVYAASYTPQPISARLAEEVLSLPIWPEITPEQQQIVVQTLQQALQA